jgi:hypothetical protein
MQGEFIFGRHDVSIGFADLSYNGVAEQKRTGSFSTRTLTKVQRMAASSPQQTFKPTSHSPPA